MDRTEILSKASEIVNGNREQDYGSPENNFTVIAELWSAYVSARNGAVEITPTDVAAMMILLKLARVSSRHAKEDNWVDVCGYAACGGEIESKEKATWSPA